MTKYIIIIVVLISTHLLAQNQSVRFNHLDVEDGLSENMVRAILQDSKGFMWFGTWDGLNRYDGYSFKVYKNIRNDPGSLRINKIRTLFEDHKGVLWVGTFGGGLSRYNPNEKNFTNFLHNPNDNNSICSDRIISIFEDSKNRIWIGTEDGGISVLDNNKLISSPDSVKFINIRNVPNDSTSISSNGILIIYGDDFKNIWFGTIDGFLNKLEAPINYLENLKIVRFQPVFKTGVNKTIFSLDKIMEDKNHPGILWMVDYYHGLFWFDTKTERFLYQFPFGAFPSKLRFDQVESIFFDSDGRFWIGTYGDGIYTLNPKENEASFGSIEHFSVNTSDPNNFSISDITDFYEDRSGMIWIETSSNGLFTYSGAANRFESQYQNSLTEYNISGKNALSVLEANDGNIWIGTEIGLDKYNPYTKKTTHYEHNPNDPASISGKLVYSLHQDSKGTIWVGTSSGLDKYKPDSDSFLHYKFDPLDSNSLSSGEIIKIFSDSRGLLWVGSWKGGLNKLIPGLNGKPDSFLHYKFDEYDPHSISDNRIMSIVEDKPGQLWIGTSDGGLNKLISDYSQGKDGSINKPKFKRYQHNLDDPNSLSNNDVRSLLVDKKGTLWIGTFGGGLNKFVSDDSKDETAKFITFSQADGLSNDVVRSILEDESGNLWLGTANGLSKFNPDKKTFWNFDESDGLKTSKFEDVSYKSKRSGMLYFGGVGGILGFQPDKIKLNSFIPQIAITSFKRYNRSGNKGIMIDEKGITGKSEITLSYDDNILTFEFAALVFNSSSKNTYAYKLQGYNENWIQLGTKRDVTFTNLDPGEYTLFVRGANNDGVWNQTGTALDIIITPPWWKSNWAFIAYGIMFIAGIFLTDRLMRKKIITQERNKAKLNEAELIKSQAEELETVDRLVKVINRAEDLNQLFNSLLEQTFTVIPQGEKSAVFLLDKKKDLFHVAFTKGYKIKDLEQVNFSPEELKKRYTQASEEIEKGIYIIDNTDHLYADEKLLDFGKAKSMLVMAVEIDNLTEAYVVFDSYSD
ncbi:MAG: two-component regulator propeller domain-containing protein, partial [Ignavibacteriota bacterium]